MAAPAPPLRLEVVSRAGCLWCDRLKAFLSQQDGGLVEWTESAVLDPSAPGYGPLRDAVLDRARRAQSTFPFVFDAATGRLVGGHDATVALVEASRVLAAVDEGGF